MDHIILTGNNQNAVSVLIRSLVAEFPNTELGSRNYFLGVELIPHLTGATVSQEKYILNLLKKMKMGAAKLVHSHFPYFLICQMQGQTLILQTIAVGALQYVTSTRQDHAFAVNKVCQFMLHPMMINSKQ